MMEIQTTVFHSLSAERSNPIISDLHHQQLQQQTQLLKGGRGDGAGQPTAERVPCIGFRVCSWVQILEFGKMLTRTFICG